jgi:hypothetical protein
MVLVKWQVSGIVKFWNLILEAHNGEKVFEMLYLLLSAGFVV